MRQFLALAAASGLLGCGGSSQVRAADGAFTSTRQVTSICATERMVVVGTMGGVLIEERGKWRKLTSRNGLPDNEVLSLKPLSGGVIAYGRTWAVEVSGPILARGVSIATVQPDPVEWKGARYRVEPTVLRRNGKVVPFTFAGTHLTGLTASPDQLFVAAYGDGLYAFDGKVWLRDTTLPDAAKEITAVVWHEGKQYVGTRRAGLWVGTGGAWKQVTIDPDEPPAHNIQSLFVDGRRLYAGTLEDGLLVREAGRWMDVVPPAISSSAPRAVLRWGDKLLVRNARNVVDAFVGYEWRPDYFAKKLPRQDIYAIACDTTGLFAAQFGGWSECDGEAWTGHFDVPELKAKTTTCILPDAKCVWIGTQGSGLVQIDRATGKATVQDERSGMPDDWITCLASASGHLYAGTFVGGLVEFEDGKWRTIPGTEGSNVTCLLPYGTGLLFGTRQSLYFLAEGKITDIRKGRGWIGTEVQALARDEGGIWIGTRTGLFFLVDAEIA